MLSADDLATLRLMFKMAYIATGTMLLLGVPLAWWLARTRSRLINDQSGQSLVQLKVGKQFLCKSKVRRY